jgi:hypothetical protein
VPGGGIATGAAPRSGLDPDGRAADCGKGGTVLRVVGRRRHGRCAAQPSRTRRPPTASAAHYRTGDPEMTIYQRQQPDSTRPLPNMIQVTETYPFLNRSDQEQ